LEHKRYFEKYLLAKSGPSEFLRTMFRLGSMFVTLGSHVCILPWLLLNGSLCLSLGLSHPVFHMQYKLQVSTYITLCGDKTFGCLVLVLNVTLSSVNDKSLEICAGYCIQATMQTLSKNLLIFYQS